MSTTIEAYQYFAVINSYDEGANVCNVMLLSGQKLMCFVPDNSDVVSICFSGVVLDPDTNAEVSKINIGAYPNKGVGVLLYTCPEGSNAVGSVRLAIDPDTLGSSIIAVGVDTPASQTTIDESLLQEYERIMSVPPDNYTDSSVSQIAVLAGQSIVARGLDTDGANISLVIAGREFDSEGNETLFNSGHVLNNSTDTGLVVYTCPTGCTAIVSIFLVNMDSVATPTVEIYLYGMECTSDSDGVYTGGGEA